MPGTFNRIAPSFLQLKALAKKRIPKFAFDYLEEGCNDGLAVTHNRKALDSVRLQPRYLEPAGETNMKTKLFQKTYDLPFGIAPVGISCMIWPKSAEILARAAKKSNIPFVLSTLSTTSIERAGELAEDCLWMQLYPPNSPYIRDDIINRTISVGCDVLVVTVDVPVPSHRPQAIQNELTAPLKFDARALFQCALRPKWSYHTLRSGYAKFETMEPYLSTEDRKLDTSTLVNETLTGSEDFEGLKKIRDKWPGKLVIKGIMTVEDAMMCLKIGADGIIVSNHGGRVLDMAVAPSEILLEICDAINGRLTIMADSGVQSGPDIARLIAKGAKYVFAGRAFMYGVGALERDGGHHTVELLHDELRKVLVQLRCHTPDDLAQRLISRPSEKRKTQGQIPNQTIHEWDETTDRINSRL